MKKEKINNDIIKYSNEFNTLKISYFNYIKDYYSSYNNCISYMDNKLSVSGETYTSKQGWFGFIWSSVVETAPKK